jgi:hypothetical protein
VKSEKYEKRVVPDLTVLGLIKVDLSHHLRFGVVIALIWFITAISMIEAQAIQAIPGDSFVESIGVNTHWLNGDVYTQNYTQLRAKLGEAGIRYLRDGTFQATYIRANDLYQSFGIKTNILIGRGATDWRPPLIPSNIDAELNEIKTQALNATVSLEAPNEYDASHGSDPNWVQTIKNYSSALYIKAKADKMLKHLPVIGPSLTSEQAYEIVGDWDQYIDYANIHLYQGNRYPGTNGWGDHGQGSIIWYINFFAGHQSPSGKYIQATEGGYHNIYQSYGLSEEAEGKYAGRMFSEFFRRGIYRTYWYELVDEGQPGPEGAFGLLRNNVSEKPAFRAVKNLITILNDKGPDFESDSLNYVLDGSVNDLRQILFQKRDGDFYLMLWLEVSSWDPQTSIDLYPPPQEVLLTLLNNHNITSATLYAFNNSADINTFILPINENQVTLNVTDKISIIKLSNHTSSIAVDFYQNK